MSGASGNWKPGIYESLPWEAYLEIDAVNNSSLNELRRSPAHWKAARGSDKDSDARRFGRLWHDSTLEPEKMHDHYAVMPDFTQDLSKEYKSPRATSEYKQKVADWEATIGDRDIVTSEWWAATHRMLIALNQNDLARQCMVHDGPAECTLVWEEPTTGILCKSRLDKWDRLKHRIGDLKTTIDATEFNKSIGKWRYHRQAAFYTDAVYQLTGERHEFVFVASEKSEPFAVVAAPLDDDSIAAGRDEYRRLLRTLARCRETGRYDPPQNPKYFHCPSWAMELDEVGLTVGGEKVAL